MKKPPSKLPPLKRLRNKADSLLTPIIIKKYPRCLLCSMPTQVAHHYIKKSESNRLRHELDNLINLCSNCHIALHCHETIYSNRIVKIKGQDWHDGLIKKKQEYCKTDRFYYEEAIERLSKELNK